MMRTFLCRPRTSSVLYQQCVYLIHKSLQIYFPPNIMYFTLYTMMGFMLNPITFK